MGILEDLDRFEDLLKKQGSLTDKQWFKEWSQEFIETEAAGAEERLEDLHDILIVYERTELNPLKEASIPLETLIKDLGFDPKEFDLDQEKEDDNN